MNDGKQSAIKWSIEEYIAPALPRIAVVAHEGSEKYGPDNWTKVSWRDDVQHAMRHLVIALNQMQGYLVEEAGEDQLAHAACRVMMAMALDEKMKITKPHLSIEYMPEGMK